MDKFFDQAETTNKNAQIPERASISKEFQWQLDHIYINDMAWEKDIEAVTNYIPHLKSYDGRLSESAENLWAALDIRDKLDQKTSSLFGYARMHRDENTANTKYQAMTSKIQSLLANTSASYGFMDPEILSLPPELLQRFIASEPRLKKYQFYFENLFRQKKHVLSAKEESLLSKLNEITQASAETFQMLARADMEFPTIIDERDQVAQLSEGRYRSFIISPKREIRQQAFEKLLNTYRKYRNTFASTLSGNIKQDIFYAKTRNYSSKIEAALETDNVPLAVYDNLITTVEKHLPALHRYVALKKHALKVPEIHMYDLYTPLVNQTKIDIPYSDGVTLVLDALSPLGNNYLANLKQGLASGWVDVYENKGKQTGAYSWGIYGVHPFVLLNYDNRYEDVSTLAHELGHAMHSYYSYGAQPYITSSYTIFCAEVASTTNEILLMDHMLNITKDPNRRLYLINQYLETMRSTVFRQTMFAEFEKIIYAKAEDGDSITADVLDSLWHDLNVKYYGPDMIVDAEIDSEWARIPHFYRSFYVYKYATGYSAATTLANQIQKEGEAAQKRYLSFLQSGGSHYSLEILKAAGVDMSSPEPIHGTLEKFSQLLEQLESYL
jgi:oligoendopeptidase F